MPRAICREPSRVGSCNLYSNSPGASLRLDVLVRRIVIGAAARAEFGKMHERFGERGIRNLARACLQSRCGYGIDLSCRNSFRSIARRAGLHANSYSAKLPPAALQSLE